MDQGPRDRELDLTEVVARVKEDANGPSARTIRVYEYLAESGKFTNWDLVCFAGEYLGSLVGSLPWLKDPVKWLLRMIYMAHYIRFEGVAWLDKPTSAGATTSDQTDDNGQRTAGP